MDFKEQIETVHRHLNICNIRNWPIILNDSSASCNDAHILAPVAIAIFEQLLDHQAGSSFYDWATYLKDSLDELIERREFVEYGKRMANVVPAPFVEF